MKFKPGDKVRITKAYKIGDNGNKIGSDAQEDIDKLGTNGIFTIKGEHPRQNPGGKPRYYLAEEFKHTWAWPEAYIEQATFEPINSRFDILDIRNN